MSKLTARDYFIGQPIQVRMCPTAVNTDTFILFDAGGFWEKL
jgi:hypothetical protein